MENKKPRIMMMIRGVPVFLVSIATSFPRDKPFRISGRSSDSRISHLSHLPRSDSQWFNVKFVPGYSGGPVLDSHEVPF
jgi:hypothetical protein